MYNEICRDSDQSYNPCNGVCMLDPKWQEYCMGSKRFVIEVMNWEYYDKREKTQINQRIQDLLAEDPNRYPYK